MSDREPMTRTYRFALGICRPIVRLWGRLNVEGVEHIPAHGPLLIVGNHDSYWDPVVIGLAAIKRRQIRALAKSSLWKVKGLNKVLDGMGQIPITRGSGDAGALDAAITELRGGSCIGVFPEGTRSLGRPLRPRSGLGRLVAAVPQAVVVPVAVTGTTDITRFPKRPRLHVRFLAPPEPMRGGESPSDYAVRVVEEIRQIAPIAIAGRKRRRLAALAEPRGE
ncbi:MAG TPA: lysophospholipid acyltransferase family protein [Solirubrobacteraceae bacterium]|nr:lysophospholipid acyltransferase family protein [Solirubrobacteraceae bacterium]